MSNLKSTTYLPKTINKSIIYNGRKNKTILPEFIKICKKSQKDLIEWLPKMLLKSGYTDIVKGDGYIYAKGTIPVLLTAHMDTVHKNRMIDFYERKEDGKHIITSPQGIGGDDRCGIYMILEIIKTHKCSVLFCEDEEIGGIGSTKFCETEMIQELEELNYLIELDRANSNDAVFYDCDNPDFTEFITENTGYKESWGSFSDISILSPECKVASVNLSCGYYYAHTLEEEVVIEEMLNTIDVVKKLLNIESKKFEYVERRYDYRFGFNNRFRNYHHDDYLDSILLCVQLIEGEYITAKGKDINEAWKNFFFKNSNICFDDVLDFDVYEL